MKPWRLGCGLLLAAGSAGLLQAQPEETLRKAVDQLWAAGNYSWHEAMATDVIQVIKDAQGAGTPAATQSTRAIPLAGGETAIGGFTAAKLLGRYRVVLLGEKSAVELNGRWRDGSDLTDTEALAIKGAPRAADHSRSYAHVLAHEFLRFVLPRAVNIRSGTGTILADIAGTADELGMLENYIERGERPAPWNPPLPSGQFSPSPNQTKALLEVTVTAANIETFSVQFTKYRRIPLRNSPAGSQPQPITTKYTFELSDIGATVVEVDPKARALFPDAVGGR